MKKILVTGLKNGWMIQRFVEEGKKLGVEVDGCFAKDLVLKGDGKSFNAYINQTQLSNFDLIYLCTGIETKFRFEWYAASSYIVKNTKTKIVNDVAIDPAMNYHPAPAWFYLKQSENTLPYPETYVIYHHKNVSLAAEKLGYPLILKIGNVHQGKAVFLINSEQEAISVINDNPDQFYTLRKFIPNDGDIRVFCVGYKAIGAMKRIPKEGEFKSNISQGGHGEKYDLEANLAIRELAERAARVTKVEVAGVDIILDKNTGDPYILEVNVGPQFEGLEKYTGVNAAKAIIEYFIEKCGE